MEAFQCYFLDIFKQKFAQFDGRARRKEYWMFVLFYTLITCALKAVAEAADPDSSLATFMTIATALFGLACFVPSLALVWRRLHDTGRSGLMALLALIPVIGGIILFVFLVLDSQPGPNKYGPNPKDLEASATRDLFV